MLYIYDGHAQGCITKKKDWEKHSLKVIDSIVENTECRIRHYCTPMQIVRQKPNVKNYNEAW